MAKPSWISLDKSSGTGRGSVNVTAEDNKVGPGNSGQYREGTLSVKTTSGLTKTVSVSQSSLYVHCLHSGRADNVPSISYTLTFEMSYKGASGDNCRYMLRGFTDDFVDSTTTDTEIESGGSGPITFSLVCTGNPADTTTWNVSNLRVSSGDLGFNETTRGIVSTTRNLIIEVDDASIINKSFQLAYEIQFA